MKKYDAIIFDIDGTIWNSTDLVAIAYNRVFEKAGISLRVTGETLTHQFGKTMDAIFDDMLPEIPEETRRFLQKQCTVCEGEILAERSGSFYPGIIETIKTLSGRYPVYIVSNAQKGYAGLVMRHGNFADYIRKDLCFGDTGCQKDGTLRILMEQEKLKCPVYVGDIQGDADACKKAGIDIIYAAYGFGSIKDPCAVIEKPVDLLSLLM